MTTTAQSTFADFDGEVALVRAGLAVVIVLVGYLFVRLERRLVRRWVRRATQRGLTRATDDAARARVELRASTLGEVTTDGMRVITWGLVLITALGQVGIEIGPLIAGAGIAGLAIGFGAQSLVKDVFSGFFILLEDQYGIGDDIQVTSDVGGIVEDITLRVTRMRATDGTVWFIPNGEIRALGNRSR